MSPSRFHALFLTGLFAFLMVSFGEFALAQDLPVPVLNENLCGLCHREAPRDIFEAGLSHRTEITCTDCHQGHPPQEREIIPACMQCHTGAPHYAQDKCLQCHTNPHRPGEITFPEKTTQPCLTCHEDQGEQLASNPSFHSRLSCTACHASHTAPPSCTECHEGHAPSMLATECARCHEAHRPLALVYAGDIPSTLCASCHEETLARLSGNGSRHKNLQCADCHRTKHGAIASCLDCHGTQHDQSLLSKFESCQVCHNTAHELNL